MVAVQRRRGIQPARLDPELVSAEEIRTPGPDNRWIGFPYPKLMNSNNSVEQGAALLLCSAEAAERLGVPATVGCSRTAAPTPTTPTACRTGTTCTRRPRCASTGRATLELAGVGVDDVDLVDLYSCFPSAVEIAAASSDCPSTTRTAR